MILRRTSKAEPPWRARFDRARSLIRDHDSDAGLADRLDAVEAALVEATADQQRLTASIAQLDPERAGRELKDALRNRSRRPGSATDALIETLQRRYRTIHALQDRLEEIETHIDATVVDLESLAARLVELQVTGGRQRDELHDDLQRLHDDLTALERAHAELDHL